MLSSYGWVECVGCADRSAYDLTVHSNRTGQPLIVQEQLAQPREITAWEVDIDKKKLGPRFRKDAKAVEEAIEALTQEERETASKTLQQEGFINLGLVIADEQVKITSDLLKIERRTRTLHTRDYTPNVIEPSFGIGRILYSLLEQTYWFRKDDAARAVSSRHPWKLLAVPPAMHNSKSILITVTNTTTRSSPSP